MNAFLIKMRIIELQSLADTYEDKGYTNKLKKIQKMIDGLYKQLGEIDNNKEEL